MPYKVKASTAAPILDTKQRILTLSDLCSEAAEHVAQARSALFGDEVDTDGALDQLDQAIACLQRFSALGRASAMNGPKAKLYSA